MKEKEGEEKKKKVRNQNKNGPKYVNSIKCKEHTHEQTGKSITI